MNNQEAKFILGAYRPDGRDASDPMFHDALAQADHDPELRAWFEQQRKFDAALGAKLRSIAPPTGLREAILTGGRVSAGKAERRWWTHPAALAAAAAIVLVAVLSTTLRRSSALSTGGDFAAFVAQDLDEAHHDHVGYPASLAAVQAQLANFQLPLTKHLTLDLAELRSKNCRAIKIGDGREVFEICFQRDGIWYHVYVGRRSDFAPGAMDPQALTRVKGLLASTAWADANHVYALVTLEGADALKRMI